MAEIVAQNVISSFLQGLISSNLSNLATKEVGLLLGVRGEITYIIEELEMMKAFLRSAEEKQETDSMVRVWVRRVREVSLDMENCMDKFEIYLKRRPNSNFLDWLGCQLQSLCTLHIRHEITTEIQDLKYRIAHISDCRLRYGITAIASGSYNTSSSTGPRFIDHRLSALFMQEAQLVGIDEPRKKLTNLLIRDEQQRRVISVLGMGGLGKTTLIKRVYEDLQMVGEYFDCHAWITISQSFNLNVLLRDIIKQVTSPDYKKNLKKIQKNTIDKIESDEDFDNMQSKEDLIKLLKKFLQNRHYIIVLDDIWSIDAWESIKHALPENNNRSRLIITTRIEEVANNCCVDAGGADYVYKLELLSKEKSMELFQKRVFGPGKHCPEHLKNVANDIVAKCGGLPLAIVAMAGVLKSMPTHDDHQQWTNLLNNLSSVLETNPSLEGMKQVLLLSYNHLPYLLKPCFLYLSNFPEDHLIKRKNLIQLWVAERLASNQYAMSAEVVAEYYFNELVSRSLILPSEVDWNGKVKSCRIHDVMLEVLIFKSMEENMVSIHGKQSRTTLQEKNVFRRLSLQRETNQIRGIPDDVDLSKVTSLSIYDYQKIPALLPRFRLLRVLVFENYSFDCEAEKGSFIQILSKLRHLRYLSLKGTILRSYKKNLKSTFSKSLSKLQSLVTLDIRNVGIRRLYSSVAKLKQLRHLLMGSSDHIMGRIISLNSKMNPGVLRNLKNLQTLVGLEINNMEITEELGFLTQLRILKISVTSKSPKILSSICVSLNKLSGSLLSLSLTVWAELPERLNLNIINHLSLLQSLQLGGSCKLPDCVSSLSNLAKLTLIIDDKHLDNDLGVIKTLPNLLYLTLSSMYYSSVELLLFTTGGFRQLQMLRIYPMEGLQSIEFQMECMPVLKKLVIIECWLLRRVIGIGFLPCLQEIQLKLVPKEIVEVLNLDAETHKNIPKLTAINVIDK